MTGPVWWVYRHFNRDGGLIYVGLTADPTRRTYNHSRVSPWWSGIARIDWRSFPDRFAARTHEKESIRLERPLYNLNHNPDRALAAARRNELSDILRAAS